MIRIALGAILALHGLVHFWFVALATRLVAFEPEMGWTGRSWLLTPVLGQATTRVVATGLLTVAAAAFVVGGAAVIGQAFWWRPALIVAATFSSVVLLVVWDGGTDLLAEKGLIAIGINLLVLIVALR